MIPHYADNKFELHDLPQLQQELVIAFVGNSLTLHGPSAEIGWEHNHGMAASRPENDYAHYLLRQLRLDASQAYIRNFYPFESDSSVAVTHVQSLQAVFAQRPPLFVIQLGDNIGTQEQLNNFAHNLQILVRDACAASPNVFCVSTWWQNPAKDHVIERVCQLYGATYVFIGDLYDRPDNSDRQQQTYVHAGIEAHPKDWGMAQVGERLFCAILDRFLNKSRRGSHAGA